MHVHLYMQSYCNAYVVPMYSCVAPIAFLCLLLHSCVVPIEYHECACACIVCLLVCAVMCDSCLCLCLCCHLYVHTPPVQTYPTQTLHNCKACMLACAKHTGKTKRKLLAALKRQPSQLLLLLLFSLLLLLLLGNLELGHQCFCFIHVGLQLSQCLGCSTKHLFDIMH